MSEVQALVDSLARRLRRPAGVDDRQFRAIAYSSHEDEIDSVRRISILGRQAPRPVTSWLESLGLMQARDVVRVPASPDLDMVARVCVPLRFHDHLLGFLWLIDAPEELSGRELEDTLRYAADLAEELYREHQQASDRRRAEAAWVARAVAGELDDDSPGIVSAAMYAVLEVRVTGGRRGPAPAGIDVRLAEAIDRRRRALPPHHQLACTERSRATVVLAAAAPAELRERAQGLLASAEAELADLPDTRVVVGVGEPATTLDALATTRAQAIRAAHLGCSMPELGPLVDWTQLGVTRLVADLVADRDPATLLPPPVQRLLADPDGGLLIRTAEMYLEQGCDVSAAAARLFVHRSSLYKRLRRVQEVAGIDIRSGADRLELHVGIRIWRMTGPG